MVLPKRSLSNLFYDVNLDLVYYLMRHHIWCRSEGWVHDKINSGFCIVRHIAQGHQGALPMSTSTIRPNNISRNSDLFKRPSFTCRRKSGELGEKPAETSMDWKPNAHTALGSTRAQWCIAPGKNCYTTFFPQGSTWFVTQVYSLKSHRSESWLHDLLNGHNGPITSL